MFLKIKMFDNEDEFGVQSFREDVSYVMQANEIVVRLIRYNENKGENLQADYFGIRTKTFSDVPELIKINLGSTSPDEQTETKHGYDGSGNRMFTGYVGYDVKISNKDIIEFFNDKNCYNIKPGTRFRIKLKDEGMYQGQFTFKEFDLIMIEDSTEKVTKEDDFRETN